MNNREPETPLVLFFFLVVNFSLLFFTTATAETLPNCTPTPSAQSRGNVDEPWSGALADGTHFNQAELEELLLAHEEWLERADDIINSAYAKSDLVAKNRVSRDAWLRNKLATNWEEENGRIVLIGAVLSGVTLDGRNLRYSNLSKSDIDCAYLAEVDFTQAVLVATNFWGSILDVAELEYADLSHSKFWDASLKKAELAYANLSGAELESADLGNANLPYAILKEARLEGTNLSNANLAHAKLANAVFEIRSERLPSINYLNETQGLDKLIFVNSPHALVELRQKLKNSGYRLQEREVTSAIESEITRQKLSGSDISEVFEGAVRWLFLELTFNYGRNYLRPLATLFLLIPVFAIFYWYAIHSSASSTAGIYLIWPQNSLSFSQPNSPHPKRLSAKGRCSLYWAFWFSLLSAFHLGWKDLSVGNWLARLNPGDYTLQGAGWLKAVSGIQSIFSLFLLVLWLLGTFGRPFE